MKRYAKATSAGPTRRQASRFGRVFCSVLAAALLALGLGAASAGAAPKVRLFVEDFGTASQPTFVNPEGIARDHSNGDLLVIDAGAGTVSRWHQDGTPSNFSGLGTNVIDAKPGGGGKPCAEEPSSCDDTPQHGFIFGGPGGARQDQVAVDESGTATDGNIYVTQTGEHLVDVFAADGHYLGQLTKYVNADSEEEFFGEVTGVAVDEAGSVYVSDYEHDHGVHKFAPSANPPVTSDNVATFNAVDRPGTLAVGSGPTAGSIFVSRWDTSFVAKLSSTDGTLAYKFSSDVTTLTTNPVNGHVFVVRAGAGADRKAAEYDASGSLGAEEVSFASLATPGQGIAVDGIADQLYVSQLSSTKIEIFSPPLPPPIPVTNPASSIGETAAVLNGTVNPQGIELEECVFEYGTTETYGETAPCAETPAEIGTGSEPVPVHADIAGLQAGALYHFRLRAKNFADVARGSDRQFATRLPPALLDDWVEGASYTGATIRAKINPRYYPTTFRVEYGPSVSYGHSTPAMPVGADNAVHTAAADLGGLEAGSTYHWRVLASNENGETVGEDGVFFTYAQPAADTCPNAAFRSGPGAQLADCRAYEMVSPVDKNGGDIAASEIPGGGGTSGYFQAAEDGGKLTYTSATAFGDAQKGAFANQYIATRASGDWSSHALNPPQGTTVFDAAGSALLDSTLLDTGTGFSAFTPDLSYALIVDWNLEPLVPEAIHGYTDLYRRDNTSDTYGALTSGDPPSSTVSGIRNLRVEARNFSRDMSLVVFAAQAALTPDAAPAHENFYQIYIHSDAGLRLVSVLPGGKGASLLNNSVGTGQVRHIASLSRAVSGDGSRVFWTTSGELAGADAGGSLYVRKNPAQAQSALDGGGACTEAAKACTVPIFEATATARAKFWTASADGSNAIFSVGTDLFEFDVEGEAQTPIAGETGGVVGASDDLSYLYFTSKEALADGATAGEWNLYLRHDTTLSLIATISAADRGFSSQVDSLNPQLRTSRVSADGRHLAFTSVLSLTGFDNSDATGEATSEIYRYDADPAQLTCVSCNPSGARPAGQDRGGLQTAAWIPGWEWSNNGSHPLSDDGSRLFFNAFDALVPADNNGVQDVYQWQAPSTGGCDTGAPSYSALNDGCLSLVSTGHSPDTSKFVDASGDGRDVFISTNSSIDPRDPGLIDIYDARQEGGFPPPPPAPPACLGDACQSVPAAPDDPTPGSESFIGAGNPKGKGAANCRSRKSHRRRNCAGKHGKHQKHGKRHHRRAQASNYRREAR